MAFKLVRNDITQMSADIIVIPANNMPVVGEGCEKAVYEAAGYEELLAARKQIGNIPVGEVAQTSAFGLKAQHIFHGAFILADRSIENEEVYLRKCYKNCLIKAYKMGAESIAFPLVETHAADYSKEEGLRIALDEIKEFLVYFDMRIFVAMPNYRRSSHGLGLTNAIDRYINSHFVDKTEDRRPNWEGVMTAPSIPKAPEMPGVMAAPSIPKAPDMPGVMAAPSMAKAPDMPGVMTAPSMPKAPEMPGVMAAPSMPKAPEMPGVMAAPSMPKAPERPEGKTGLLSRITGAKSNKSSLGSNLKGNIVENVNYCAPEEVHLQSEQRVYSEPMHFVFDDKYETALNERMRHASDSFSEYLIYLIESKGMKNSDVYKAALVNKKTFSKVKNSPDYHPNKMTAMCLCVGAQLNLDETKDLLARAGYALSPCDKTDIIFSFFIEHSVYDIFEIDIQLEEHGLPSLVNEDF